MVSKLAKLKNNDYICGKLFIMWIKRIYENKDDFFKRGKVNLLYGPRRTGKTWLIRMVTYYIEGNKFYGEGDDVELRKLLNSENKTAILSAFSDYDCIVIDEAQSIKKIGQALKIMVDNFDDKFIIASGSSSFKLSSKVGAPLTGRSNTKILYPLSIIEMKEKFGGMEILKNLNFYLIYGMYPEVNTLTDIKEKKNYLFELRNSYLLKDILQHENIRNSDKLYDLLKLLSFQIGQEVSLSELGNSLELAKQTVARYLDLLEKSFIIKKINGFSRNLRKEVTKTSRYYFFDNGVRNAIINNFNTPESRDDLGMLWENFIVMERLKKQEYHNILSNNYFWRTYDQKEVDMVEERDGKLYGFEIKWNPSKAKVQHEWLETYDNAEFEVITKDNFLQFIT